MRNYDYYCIFYIVFYRSTTMSAPGKALVVGGYLVLDQANCGFTVGVSSRFYTTVKLMEKVCIFILLF